jgi:hypothetical protein
MTHYYERNIVDIKNELSTHLTDILVPLLYEGILSLYNNAEERNKKFELLAQQQTIQVPGVIKLFKAFLKGIPQLSSQSVEEETNRIRTLSNCADFFDNLIKAVIKSYIILLTYNVTGKTCNLVNDKYHERININDFIHKCYIACSKIFYDNPELFWTEHTEQLMKLYKNSAYKYIKQAIVDAIHQTLPMNLILQEYLSHDYIVESDHKSQEKTEKDIYYSNKKIMESESQQAMTKEFEEKFEISKKQIFEADSNEPSEIPENDDDNDENELKQNLEKIIAHSENKQQSIPKEIFVKSPDKINPTQSLEKLEKALSEQEINRHFDALIND